MNPLLTTVAVALLAAGAAAQTIDPSKPVVHVEYGRAVLVQRGSRGELLLPETERSVSGVAYLLVGAGGRASVSWLGQSSLLLHGPTEIEWAPGDERQGSGETIWSVLRLGAIDVEVRRGSPELKLPGGWRTHLGQGSFHVSGNGRDACDFEIRAGEELELRPELRGGRVRPPVAVATGMRVRLSDRLIAVSRPDATADAGSWDEVTWPWLPLTAQLEPEVQPSELESVSIEPDPPKVTVELHPILPMFEQPVRPPSFGSDLAPRNRDTDPPTSSPLDFRSRPRVEPAPEVAVETPALPIPVTIEPPARPALPTPEPVAMPVPAPVEAPRVAVETPTLPRPVDPVPEPVVEGPAPIRTEGRAEGRTEPPTRPVVVQQPARAGRRTAPTAFDTSDWRGFAFDELQRVGDAAVEASDAVRATPLGATRFRVALSARAEAPVWFFGKDEDVQLHPGSSVTISVDGFLQSQQGLTRSEAVPAGRPPFSSFAEPTQPD